MTTAQWIELVSTVLSVIGAALAAHAHRRITRLERRK